MARTPGTQPTPRSPQPVGKALTAAGISYPGLMKRSRPPVQKAAWQHDIWDLFEEVGEFAFASTWQSNVCSRARLVIKKRDSKGVLQTVPANDKAVLALNELTGGPEGQGEFLRMSTLHFGVAAECYLVNRRLRSEDAPMRDESNPIGEDEYIWEVVGVEEINDSAGVWTLSYEGGRTITLDENDTVIRLWMPHPRNRFNAFSLSKAALPILREIRGYDAHVQAQIDSRLTGNGLMLFPAEMTIKPPQTYDMPQDPSTADIVTAVFLHAASQSKQVRGTAEAQVPMVMTPPGEFIDKIKHIKFWTQFDGVVVEKRKDALSRLATTLDLPKEVVTGTGDMNRWGAWQVEESSVKVHIEPKLEQLAAVIMREYLHPAVGDDSYVITVDTAVLRLRPNRSKEALELNDRGLLSSEATLRETGFDPDTDAMGDDERKLWLLWKISAGSWSPEMIAAAIKALGIKIDLPLPTDNTPREARPTPSLQDHPTRDVPEKSVADGTQQDVGLAASGDPMTCAAMLAYRAIERAGNRLRTISRVKPDTTTPAHMVHTVVPVFPDKVDELIEHAWSGMETFGTDARQIDLARNYTRFLLTERVPYVLTEAVSYVRNGRLD